MQALSGNVVYPCKLINYIKAYAGMGLWQWLTESAFIRAKDVWETLVRPLNCVIALNWSFQKSILQTSLKA